MKNYEQLDFTHFRDTIYDILVYNLDTAECIFYILSYFVHEKMISKTNTSKILMKTHTFLKYFNNNYRPIYHLETILFYIILKISNYDEQDQSNINNYDQRNSPENSGTFSNRNTKRSIHQKEIRQMALKYHPDKNKDADAVEKFQKIHEAYEFLLCEKPDFNYSTILSSFLSNVFTEDVQAKLMTTIIHKLMKLCNKSALFFIRKIDKEILENFCHYRKQQRYIEHFRYIIRKHSQHFRRKKEKRQTHYITSAYRRFI